PPRQRDRILHFLAGTVYFDLNLLEIIDLHRAENLRPAIVACVAVALGAQFTPVAPHRLFLVRRAALDANLLDRVLLVQRLWRVVLFRARERGRRILAYLDDLTENPVGEAQLRNRRRRG